MPVLAMAQAHNKLCNVLSLCTKASYRMARTFGPNRHDAETQSGVESFKDCLTVITLTPQC